MRSKKETEGIVKKISYKNILTEYSVENKNVEQKERKKFKGSRLLLIPGLKLNLKVMVGNLKNMSSLIVNKISKLTFENEVLELM